ncbi:hypothetical protein PENSPDRAFT_679550 [Peniophora sp. CONT]|nr:hypothetical protein PENSPDRAFT_679550 [Peniophora sp. CONT]
MSPSNTLPSLPSIGAIAVLSYLLFVRLTRWRVYNHVHRKYAHRIADFDTLTLAEAQDITHAAMLWDVPSIVMNSMSFAIVRTYAFPAMSRILCGTKELQPDTVSRRYIDTAILVATYSVCPFRTKGPPSEFYVAANGTDEDAAAADPRAYLAIARMNWLHEHYPIKNDDFLVTLAFLIFLPVRWAERFGWRTLSPLEVHARFVFWKHIGELMHIRDIPDSAVELEVWAEEYEARHMTPADTNHILAEGMLTELASSVPSFARGLFRRLVICVMGERMRIAMKLPVQPPAVHALLDIGAALVRFAGRHLFPPRLHAYCAVSVKPVPIPKGDNEPTRMHPLMKVTKPWYLPRTTGMWRVLEKLMLALGLRSIDDVPAPKYDDKGYRLEEIGPVRWKTVGHALVMQKAGEMMGCPVQGVWAQPSTKIT